MRVIVAIIAITLLEGVAVWTGTDGAAFGVAIAAIAGLGGYALKAKVNKG